MDSIFNKFLIAMEEESFLAAFAVLRNEQIQL